jgi:hypothetical protein
LVGEGAPPDSLYSGNLIEVACGAEVLWRAGAVTSPGLYVRHITALPMDQARGCQKNAEAL